MGNCTSTQERIFPDIPEVVEAAMRDHGVTIDYPVLSADELSVMSADRVKFFREAREYTNYFTLVGQDVQWSQKNTNTEMRSIIIPAMLFNNMVVYALDFDFTAYRGLIAHERAVVYRRNN